MNPGQKINIQAVILRVEAHRVDAQTADGQLIQTNLSNVVAIQHKAVLNAPENKNGKIPERKNSRTDRE